MEMLYFNIEIIILYRSILLDSVRRPHVKYIFGCIQLEHACMLVKIMYSIKFARSRIFLRINSRKYYAISFTFL